MEEEGQHIIKLNIGNIAAFGLEPPDEIVQDMIRNLPNAAGYTDSKGLFAPRKAIVHYTQQKHVKGVAVDDVFLGNGASELITMSMNALLNDGDEVLIPAPDYPLWTASVALSGGTPVHYLCDEASDWLPDLDDMAAKITPRTRAIVVINPNNPTGALYPAELLEKIVELARRHGLIVFADEIYDKTLYDGAQPHLDRLARRRRALPHLQRPVEELPLVRLPRRLDGGLGREAPRAPTTSRASACWRRCACARTRRASSRSRPRSAATRASTTWSRPAAGSRASATSRTQLLTAIPGVTCVKPKAALYMFPKLDPKLYPIDDDQQFAYELLAEQKVLIVQGTGFNWPRPDHLRVVFLPNSDDLTEAIGRIATLPRPLPRAPRAARRHGRCLRR